LIKDEKMQDFEGFGWDLQKVALFPGEKSRSTLFCRVRKPTKSKNLSLLIS